MFLEAMRTSDQRTFHRLDKPRKLAGEHFKDAGPGLSPGMARLLTTLGLDAEQPPDSPAAWQAFLRKVDQAYTTNAALPDASSLAALPPKQGNGIGPVFLPAAEYDALRASEERHRTLTEYAAEAIIVLDVETGHFIDSNTNAEVFFGLSSDRLYRTGPAELSPAYQPDGRRSVEAFQEEMARVLNGEVRVFEWHCLNAMGREIPCEVRLVRMPSAGQWLVRGSITDITERKRTEEVLIQAREQAEEMSRLKTAFLNNMSHEIRTPLTAIIGFSTILADDITPEHKELIELIGQSGKRLLNTLNAVLDLSMLEAGTFMPENEWFDIVETAEEKVAEMQLLAREKRIEIDLITSKPHLPVYLDRTCLDRILTHLIDNAIKFTEQGHVTVVVEAGLRRVDIRVDDTGVGIGEAFQPHLFDEFKQESTGLDRDHAGVGLGLAVTGRMVTLMGGEIAVTSEKGRGSSFLVTFTQPIQSGRSTLAGHFNFLDVTRPKPRILVVEDTPEIELLIEHMLGDVYELVVTSDEAGALSKVRQQSFDLVLMDINLGSARTGVDVMKTVRQLPNGAECPIVAMTAYALLEDRIRFLEAGFDGYLSKPFSVQQAYEVIESLLNV